MKPKILTTLPEYTRAVFVQDVMAGLSVAMVALPLSLAIAIASGADPAKGLVTAIVAGFLISLLGGSRVQIGGPTGAFIVVVFGVIVDHGYDEAFGARPLKRAIQHYVEDPLSDKILMGEFAPGDEIEIDADPDDEKLTFTALSGSKA